MTSGVPVRVRLLGRFELELPGGKRAGPWRRPSARRLVQLLCLDPERRMSRSAVAEVLVPHLAPARAANAVAKALSMARSAIGPIGGEAAPAIEADRTSIWLSPALELHIDLEEHVAALRAALARRPGAARECAIEELLAHPATPIADEPYADWAAEARGTVDELRLQAALALARDRSSGVGSADARAVIAAWTEVSARDPASEEAAMALIRTHAAAGEREQAIRAYLACVRALRSELDAGPSPELEAAYAAMLARPQQRLDLPEPSDWLWGRRLFGRGAVLARIRRRMTAAHAGRGPGLLVTGAAGIGKSHLLAAVAVELERAGWRLGLGRSVPDDRRTPFAALRQALAPLVDAAAVGSPPLAELLGLRRDGPSTDGEEPAADPALLATEVAALLDRASAHAPVILVLDDLQWADLTSQHLLRRLTLRPARRRWALLAAARTDEPTADLSDLGPAVDRIELGPLPAAAAASAVRAALARDSVRPQPRQVAAAVVRSGGNPFFAIELARQDGAVRGGSLPAASVPAAIVDLLRERLESVSPAARTMLSIVALAAGEASHDLVLTALARLGAAGESQPAHVGLDELLAARLVVEDGAHLSLVHPLLREAAVTLVNAVRKSAIHDAIAVTLEDAADGAPRDLDAAARHRLAAFESARLRNLARPAAEAGFAAGHRARRAHAAAVAMALLRDALDAYGALSRTEREPLHDGASAAWLAIGNIHLDDDADEAAAAAYRRARDEAPSDAGRARAASALAGIPYRHGDLARALTTYEAGIAALGGDDPAARARLESDAAWVLGRLGREDEARSLLRRSAPLLLDAPETSVRCRTCDRLGVLLEETEPDEALSWYARGIAEALAHDEQRELMVLSLHRGAFEGRRGRRRKASSDLERASAIAEAAHDRYMRSVIHWVSAEVADGAGDAVAALAERDAEVAILATLGNPRHLAAAQAHRAELLRRRRRPAQARAAAEAARAAAREADDPAVLAHIEERLATLPARGKSSGTGRA